MTANCFFFFSQGVAITFLIEIGIITAAFNVATEQDKVAIGRNIQDFFICFEMMLAALAHLFAFSHRPFIDMAAVNDSCCLSFRRALDTSDERSDVTDHLRQVYLRARDSFRQRDQRHFDYPTETTTLIALQPRTSTRPLIPRGPHATSWWIWFQSCCLLLIQKFKLWH